MMHLKCFAQCPVLSNLSIILTTTTNYYYYYSTLREIYKSNVLQIQIKMNYGSHWYTILDTDILSEGDQMASH